MALLTVQDELPLPKEIVRSSEPSHKLFEKHVIALIKQLLKSEQLGNEWFGTFPCVLSLISVEIIFNFATRACQSIKLEVKNGDLPDIREYTKVGEESLTEPTDKNYS